MTEEVCEEETATEVVGITILAMTETIVRIDAITTTAAATMIEEATVVKENPTTSVAVTTEDMVQIMDEIRRETMVGISPIVDQDPVLVTGIAVDEETTTIATEKEVIIVVDAAKIEYISRSLSASICLDNPHI